LVLVRLSALSFLILLFQQAKKDIASILNANKKAFLIEGFFILFMRLILVSFNRFFRNNHIIR